MRKFRTIDGEVVIGATLRQVADHLRAGSLMAAEHSLQAFMDGFAKRYHQMHHISLPTHSPEAFVEALLATGYLLEISTGQ